MYLMKQCFKIAATHCDKSSPIALYSKICLQYLEMWIYSWYKNFKRISWWI